MLKKTMNPVQAYAAMFVALLVTMGLLSYLLNKREETIPFSERRLPAPFRGVVIGALKLGFAAMPPPTVFDADGNAHIVRALDNGPVAATETAPRHFEGEIVTIASNYGSPALDVTRAEASALYIDLLKYLMSGPATLEPGMAAAAEHQIGSSGANAGVPSPLPAPRGGGTGVAPAVPVAAARGRISWVNLPNIGYFSERMPIFEQSHSVVNTGQVPNTQLDFSVKTRVHDGLVDNDATLVVQRAVLIRATDSGPELLPIATYQATWTAPVGVAKKALGVQLKCLVDDFDRSVVYGEMLTRPVTRGDTSALSVPVLSTQTGPFSSRSVNDVIVNGAVYPDPARKLIKF